MGSNVGRSGEFSVEFKISYRFTRLRAVNGGVVEHMSTPGGRVSYQMPSADLGVPSGGRGDGPRMPFFTKGRQGQPEDERQEEDPPHGLLLGKFLCQGGEDHACGSFIEDDGVFLTVVNIGFHGIDVIESEILIDHQPSNTD